jgi:hypothetical protein
MPSRRLPVWFVALVIGLCSLVMISGLGVPDVLISQAAASGPDPEQAVDGRAVPGK